MGSRDGSASTAPIVPAEGDVHDCAYRFGKPLNYLSEHERVRLHIFETRFQPGPLDTGGSSSEPGAINP